MRWTTDWTVTDPGWEVEGGGAPVEGVESRGYGRGDSSTRARGSCGRLVGKDRSGRPHLSVQRDQRGNPSLE